MQETKVQLYMSVNNLGLNWTECVCVFTNYSLNVVQSTKTQCMLQLIKVTRVFPKSNPKYIKFT